METCESAAADARAKRTLLDDGQRPNRPFPNGATRFTAEPDPPLVARHAGEVVVLICRRHDRHLHALRAAMPHIAVRNARHSDHQSPIWGPVALAPRRAATQTTALGFSPDRGPEALPGLGEPPRRGPSASCSAGCARKQLARPGASRSAESSRTTNSGSPRTARPGSSQTTNLGSSRTTKTKPESSRTTYSGASRTTNSGSSRTIPGSSRTTNSRTSWTSWVSRSGSSWTTNSGTSRTISTDFVTDD